MGVAHTALAEKLSRNAGSAYMVDPSFLADAQASRIERVPGDDVDQAIEGVQAVEGRSGTGQHFQALDAEVRGGQGGGDGSTNVGGLVIVTVY